MTQKSTKKLRWFLSGSCAIILLFVGFVFALNRSVPTEDRTPYYERYVALVAESLSHPEQNGLTELMRAIGPKIFSGWAGSHVFQDRWDEANPMSWTEFRHHPDVAEWWERVWRPNCEKLQVDPEAEPPYWNMASECLYRRLKELEKTTPEKLATLKQFEQLLTQRDTNDTPLTEAEWETLNAYESPYAHAERLSTEPWSRTKEPDAASYLDKQTPLLDIFAHAVRQPYFAAYTPEPWEIEIQTPVPLPQKSPPSQKIASLQLTSMRVSPQLCSLADATRQRAFMRLGADDLDGAIHDMMTIFHTACAYKRGPNLVSWMEGDRQEMRAYPVLQAILSRDDWTDTQLLSLQSELDSLPQSDIFQMTEGERWIAQYDLNDTFALASYIPFRLRMDRQKIWQTLEPYYAQWRAVAVEPNAAKRLALYDVQAAEVERRQKIAQTRMDESHSLRGQFENVCNILSSLCSVDKRTDQWLTTIYPDFRSQFRIDCQTQTLRKLGRIGVALERYRLSEGRYPDTLDALVEKNLWTTDLLDPCSGKIFIYRAMPWNLPTMIDAAGRRCPPPQAWRPHPGNQYQLYSIGWNREDNMRKLFDVTTETILVTDPRVSSNDDLCW